MNKLLLVVKMLPVIIQLIKAVEEALPGQGKGELKLMMVRSFLEETNDAVQEAWPMIEKTIGVVVRTFNKVGWA